MNYNVSPEFRQLIMQTFPALPKSKPFAKLLCWLAFSSCQVELKEEPLVRPTSLPHEVLCGFNNSDPTNYRSGDFLAAFKSKVLPEFTWAEWIPPSYSTKGRTRYVTNFGFTPEITTAIESELEYFGPKVNLITGAKIHAVSKTRDRKQTHLEYLEEKQAWALSPAQKLILDTMEANHGVAMAERFNRYREPLLAAANQLPTLSRQHQLRVLGQIAESARTYYYTSPRTCRLHPSQNSPAYLKKELRHLLCQGWVELDLVTSQFAILAAILNAPLAMAFVKSRLDLWTYLNGGEKPTPEAKKLLKTFVYSLVFGSTYWGLKERAKHLKFSLLENPMIAELYRLRQSWFKTFQGAIVDVWGNVHSGRKDSSLASSYIHSIEMELVSTAFELPELKARAMVSIQLFQHDGLTISIGDTRELEAIESAFQNNLAKKAETLSAQLGIDLSGVRFSFDYLPLTTKEKNI